MRFFNISRSLFQLFVIYSSSFRWNIKSSASLTKKRKKNSKLLRSFYFHCVCEIRSRRKKKKKINEILVSHIFMCKICVDDILKRAIIKLNVSVLILRWICQPKCYSVDIKNGATIGPKKRIEHIICLINRWLIRDKMQTASYQFVCINSMSTLNTYRTPSAQSIVSVVVRLIICIRFNGNENIANYYR